LGNILKHTSIEGRTAEKTLSSWKDILYSFGIGGNLSPKVPDVFFMNTIGCKFGNSDLFFYQAEAVTHNRTKKDCSINPSDVFMLSRVNKGSILLSQGNREALIEAGGCFLAFSGEPLCRDIKTSCEASTLILPHSLLQKWLPFPFDITATPLVKISPFGKALAETFRALTPTSIKNLAVTPDSITEQMCCLLALIAGPPKTVSSSYRQASFRRIRESLRAHCCERGFDLPTLAHEHGVSSRTIQSTFASAGTNFGRELMAMRMEKARWFLDDYRHDKKSINEISNLLGYRHSSHFITNFHHTFGTSPASYRRISRT
jgi:AraC-like DNA-binding protein